MSKSTDPIFLDIETIPTQDARIIEHMRNAAATEAGEAVAALRADAENIKVPKNYSKPETIAAYIAEKKAALDADIEAAVAKFAAKFDEAWRATGLDGAFGQVVCASLAQGDEFPVGIYVPDWQSADAEVRVLQAINEEIDARTSHHKGQCLVGHNIMGFDRPFLRQRGIIRQVRMHPMFTAEVKPWDMGSTVYDTMIAWSGDPRGRVKLDKLCLALGIDLKGSELDEDIDGSKVWDFVREGKLPLVSRYCDYDVIRCRAVYSRLQFRPIPATNDPADPQETPM